MTWLMFIGFHISSGGRSEKVKVKVKSESCWNCESSGNSEPNESSESCRNCEYGKVYTTVKIIETVNQVK